MKTILFAEMIDLGVDVLIECGEANKSKRDTVVVAMQAIKEIAAMQTDVVKH